MRGLTVRGQLLRQAFLALVAVFVLVPVWVLVTMATDGALTGYPDGFHPVPVNPNLDRFAEAIARQYHELGYLGLLRNSLIVAGSAALASLVLGASMAYAFARLRFPGGGGGLLVVLLGAFLPPVALALPLYLLFIALERSIPAIGDFGLRDSVLDLEEAAFVDGASRFMAYRRITLPLAMPSILVAALVAFLLAYTEFALAWMFIDSERNVTLAMVLAEAQTGFFSANWGLTAAHALLMTWPVVVIFLVLQRALLRGAMAGAGAD